MVKVKKKVLERVTVSKIGADVLGVVTLLKQQGELSEFFLAKKLNDDINAIRNKIYRLQHLSLVSYTKKKDEIKGWYIYYWSIIPEAFNQLYKTMLKEEMSNIKEDIKFKEENSRYGCIQKCRIISMEDALQAQFACPHCGELLKLIDYTKDIEKLKKKMKQVKKSMDLCP